MRSGGRGRPCAFFNGRPGSCRKGDECPFLHQGVAEQFTGGERGRVRQDTSRAPGRGQGQDRVYSSRENWDAIDRRLQGADSSNAVLALQLLRRLALQRNLVQEQYQALFRAFQICIEHGDPQGEFLSALRTMSGDNSSSSSAAFASEAANSCMEHVERLMHAFNKKEPASADACEVGFGCQGYAGMLLCRCRCLQGC